MTGLSAAAFDALAAALLPRYRAAAQARLSRSARQRAVGGGRAFELPLRDQLPLAAAWPRRYPTNAVPG